MEKRVAIPQNRESADAILAKNLVVARLISGMTQHELAARSLISRATIAQIETGSSDPRLSTINQLAAALNLPPLILLVGAEDVRVLSALHAAAGGSADEIPMTASDLDRMKRLIRTGMLKDRLHAAQLAATLARKAGRNESVAVIAAIFSAVDPGHATQVGCCWENWLQMSKNTYLTKLVDPRLQSDGIQSESDAEILIERVLLRVWCCQQVEIVKEI